MTSEADEREIRGQAHRIDVLENELKLAAAILQKTLPIGQVKHIGLREVSAGVEQLAAQLAAARSEEVALTAEREGLAGEVERLRTQNQRTVYMLKRSIEKRDRRLSRVAEEIDAAHDALAAVIPYVEDDHGKLLTLPQRIQRALAALSPADGEKPQ